RRAHRLVLRDDLLGRRLRDLGLLDRLHDGLSAAHGAEGAGGGAGLRGTAVAAGTRPWPVCNRRLDRAGAVAGVAPATRILAADGAVFRRHGADLAAADDAMAAGRELP